MAFGPPAMGYDRAITIFSPDGRLYQVEYATEAVRRGWTTIGVRTKECVVLVVEKRKLHPFVDLDALEKIYIIDDHIGATFAGWASDGRVLVDHARLYAIRHRLLYDEPISVEYLAKLVGDIKQAYTQHAGVRPFGTSLIIGGIDDKGPRLFVTEPGGQVFPYYLHVIGSGAQAAQEFFEKHYKYDLNIKDTILLAVNGLAHSIEGELGPDRLEVGYIDVYERKFKKLSKTEIGEILQKIKT